MAGDWIKMRIDLQTHPKVVRILSATKSDKFRVIGGLHSVWSVFDTHSSDGVLQGYTPETMDHIIGWDGFSNAMIAVGWMSFDGSETLELPEFTEHSGQSAKRRAEDQKRKKLSRAGQESVRNMSANEVDEKKTREEKRRLIKTKEKKQEISLKEFLEQCKTNSEKPIRDEDPIFDWTEKAGVPLEFLHIAWLVFKDKFQDSDKKQADWRSTFRNYVKSDWLKVWYFKDGECLLTTVGVAKQNQLRKAA